MVQIASRFLPAFFAYQTSSDPHLNDETDAQYWFSSVLCVLNFLSSNLDVGRKMAKEGTIVAGVIDKLLDPDVERKMKACERRMGARFEDDFGSMLQFVSTLMLYSSTLSPRTQELVPRCKEWEGRYRGKFIQKVSQRLRGQIEEIDPFYVGMVKAMQKETLVCGVAECRVLEKEGLVACARCTMQRYCGGEHQKKDWKWHKAICTKGLGESVTSGETGVN